ncbi:hypothetical protein EW146_g6169 [Bondarzewia mesenterica]|uniref:XRRM domain-containing protein n=1 Tax=Bondarzewia mesenterica TaxID=1095465 RepID=A0A4S4LPE6_9AGAM|nr:hypothetical protein EW146_g6169 [Bondarzewia mesenterica]
MSLPFVPRSLRKPSKPTSCTQRYLAQPISTPIDRDLRSVDEPSAPKRKERQLSGQDGTHEEDLAILLSLALSDHALWKDPALRDPNRDGYVALAMLLDTASAAAGFTQSPSEMTVVKALRQHSNDIFDIQMIMMNTSHSTRYASGTAGGFQVRRRDWHSVVQQFHAFNRNYWQSRTIYIENIPPSQRSIVGIARFIISLLFDPFSIEHANHIQTITIPSHHRDVSFAPPKCKGFALVTLSLLDDVEKLLRRWPWNCTDSSDAPGNERKSDFTDAATFAGFRTLPKARWDELQNEYEAYRTGLLTEVASSHRTHGYTSSSVQPFSTAKVVPSRPAIARESSKYKSDTPQATLGSTTPYPPNCLIFISNIHPATNKTTLRTLLSAAFQQGDLSPDGVDYVDFIKGLDTCYIRLATPKHAECILIHFASRTVIQSSALDSSGKDSTLATTRKPLRLELVQGRKEELYWERVPEKVRRQAVQRALSLNLAHPGPDSREGLDESTTAESEGQRRKKQKRH